MQQTEAPIYSNGGNIISRSKAIIGGTTFAMRNVTSVRASGGDDRPRKVGWAILALAVVVGIMGGIVYGVFIGIMGLLLALLFKPSYTVAILTTNGKEFGALRTHDPGEAKRIVDAFNQAIEQV